jgi:hypothetical protein
VQVAAVSVQVVGTAFDSEFFVVLAAQSKLLLCAVECFYSVRARGFRNAGIAPRTKNVFAVARSCRCLSDHTEA